MTRIRPISIGELEDFAAVAGPEHATDQLAYVTRLLEQRATRIDWCFLADADPGIVGRVALWTLPKVGKPLAIILLDAADDGMAGELLARAVAVSAAARSETLESVVDQPPQSPQWQRDPARRHEWLTRAGFGARRATSRWERGLDGRAPADSPRLNFRTLPDVGNVAFRDAVERVSAGSLDRYTRSERDRIGAAAEARQTIAELEEMDFEPSWWEVAYDRADELVGLVMPTLAPSMGTIGYIGVVPEQRGRGYVDDLLARGTATLLRTPAPTLRADADLDNAPMAAAFARAGWSQIGTRREYELRL